MTDEEMDTVLEERDSRQLAVAKYLILQGFKEQMRGPHGWFNFDFTGKANIILAELKVGHNLDVEDDWGHNSYISPELLKQVEEDWNVKFEYSGIHSSIFMYAREGWDESHTTTHHVNGFKIFGIVIKEDYNIERKTYKPLYEAWRNSQESTYDVQDALLLRDVNENGVASVHIFDLKYAAYRNLVNSSPDYDYTLDENLTMKIKRIKNEEKTHG